MKTTGSELQTVQKIDDLYKEMNIKSKQQFKVETLIFIVVLLILIGLFGISISSLNNQLTQQITENKKLVNRLDQIEVEMRAIRQNIYEKSGITVKEIQQQLITDVIAKKVNRRSSPEQQKALESYQKDKSYSNLKDNVYYLTQAAELSADNKLTPALQSINRSIELKGNISTPYSVKSEILAKQGNIVAATEAQTTAINIESELPFSEVLANYYNTRGFLYIKQKMFANALDDFQKGSSIASGEEKSYILENAVLVALYQEQWQNAFDISTRLIDFKVDGGWKWFLRAMAADKINNKSERKKARAKWQQSINADPNANTIELLKAALEQSNLSEYQKWL
jgi:tetratricopeptide (TPR) repeat protein